MVVLVLEMEWQCLNLSREHQWVTAGKTSLGTSRTLLVPDCRYLYTLVLARWEQDEVQGASVLIRCRAGPWGLTCPNSHDRLANECQASCPLSRVRIRKLPYCPSHG